MRARRCAAQIEEAILISYFGFCLPAAAQHPLGQRIALQRRRLPATHLSTSKAGCH
jgi:hypothetical protein